MELSELLSLTEFPCVRYPPFSKTLRCYEKYITNAVDLKLEPGKSLNDYIEVIEYVNGLSLKLYTEDTKLFKLHLSNNMGFDGEIYPIDNEFEVLFFDVLEAFNSRQPFILEFQYKTENTKHVYIPFLQRLVSYLKDNDNIIVSICIGEEVSDDFTFLNNTDFMNYVSNLL
jgi:hypothetical protein